MKLFEKKYIARWVLYNIFNTIKLKIKTKPTNIETINLVLEDYYGIGNRIFAIINAINYYNPKNINIYWNNEGWVSEKFYNLFNHEFNCKINEFNNLDDCKNWKNTKNERTIYTPQASLITKDIVEINLINGNLNKNTANIFKKLFQQLKPTQKILKRINDIELPNKYIALQIRNATDWDEYGRNEDINSFLEEIKKYPKDTIFYLSCMNKETSVFIKNNVKHKIIELPNKDYSSMFDAITDLYIMSKAYEGIYSYGSTFGELSWWLSKDFTKFKIIGSSNRWIK